MRHVSLSEPQQLTQRWKVLYQRKQAEADAARLLDPWRHMLTDQLADVIWEDVPENFAQRLVTKTDISSVTDTNVAMLSGRRPKITVTPLDAALLSDATAANALESIIYGFHHELSRDRPVALQNEAAEWCVHRGYIVGRYIMLSPSERGEKTEEAAPLVDPETGETVPRQVVTDPGRFPIEVFLPDPHDCVWVHGRDGRVIEYIHQTSFTWDTICDMYPDIYEHAEFRRQFEEGVTDSLLNSEIEVLDYWNNDENAIVIDGKFYKKPTKHHYLCCPVIVEVARGKRVKRDDAKLPRFEGTPFCAAMLESIRQASWASSVLASNLDEVGIAKLVMEGIDPRPNVSPWWGLNSAGKLDFQFKAELGPNGRVIPTFGNEKLKYLEPPQIVGVWQEFKQDRLRDAQLVSYAESILSGAQQIELSGYAYAQIKQACIARLEPYRACLDRFHSRLYEALVALLVVRWDIGDAQLALTYVQGGQGKSLTVSREQLRQIRSVEFLVIPDVPTDQEKEWNALFQAMTVGALSQRTVIEKMGIVDNPDAELERMAFEEVARNDPTIKMALAKRYMKRNGLDQEMNELQAPAPQQPQALGPGAASMQQQPPAQAQLQQQQPAQQPVQPGALQPAPEQAPQGGIPPEVMQLAQQLQQQQPELQNVPVEQIALAIMQQASQQQGVQA